MLGAEKDFGKVALAFQQGGKEDVRIDYDGEGHGLPYSSWIWARVRSHTARSTSSARAAASAPES
jgi:hypothetical protein